MQAKRDGRRRPLPGHTGPQLADAAAHALTDAMALSMIAAAAVALLGFPLVLRRLPARHQPVRLQPPR